MYGPAATKKPGSTVPRAVMIVTRRLTTYRLARAVATVRARGVSRVAVRGVRRSHLRPMLWQLNGI
jgi:hypothetical protein